MLVKRLAEQSPPYACKRCVNSAPYVPAQSTRGSASLSSPRLGVNVG
jgi:hypothetical protein